MHIFFKKIFRREELRKAKQKNEMIKKFREFDMYQVDYEVCAESSVHIPKKLPSEPFEGITYRFGPSGYVGDLNSNNCVIITEWRNINNYCHWIFSELPVLFLAFSSNARNIYLPTRYLKFEQPFQKRWMDVLQKVHDDKTVVEIENDVLPERFFMPINHDTSKNSKRLIGRASYDLYHHSRSTPYLVKKIKEYIPYFDKSAITGHKKIYINRETRRLENEEEIQIYLKKCGFYIVSLEELSTDEQVALFAQATHIIGFHGAGLANIIFCNDNVKIIEIVDIDCVYPCYKDGENYPGAKSSRTYFHIVSHWKGLDYNVIESSEYTLAITKLEPLL